MPVCRTTSDAAPDWRLRLSVLIMVGACFLGLPIGGSGVSATIGPIGPDPLRGTGMTAHMPSDAEHAQWRRGRQGRNVQADRLRNITHWPRRGDPDVMGFNPTTHCHPRTTVAEKENLGATAFPQEPEPG